ncbi:golgin subfamily A member 6-like protein 25 [Chironomus tepperi]|uniref:golgin subfamily A member 6-like protein 25 n=1 Tax=Chironomus tepperi TaxID=113505 RepID=UPI00391F4DDF
MKKGKYAKKLLANKASSIKNEEKLMDYEVQWKLESLEVELEEKDRLIRQMKEELKQKKAIISQKDIVIGQCEDKIKQKDIIIDQLRIELEKKDNDFMKQEENLTKQQNLLHDKELIILQNFKLLQKKDETIINLRRDIIELNEIIDEKELVIMKKEDLIDEKIEIIRTQKLKIEQMNSSVKELHEYIYKLEEANKRARAQINHHNRMRKPGECETLYDQLKMHYHNSMIRSMNCEERLQQLEHNAQDMCDYIDNLHNTLERHGIFDESAEFLDGVDECADEPKMLPGENDENSCPNASSNVSAVEDFSIKRITNELMGLMNDEEGFLEYSDYENKDVKKKQKSTKGVGKKKKIKVTKKVKFSDDVKCIYF